MAMTTCKNCNKRTNTAVLDYEQEKCVATFSDETKKYVKGCGYETASDFDKKFADSVINR